MTHNPYLNVNAKCKERKYESPRFDAIKFVLNSETFQFFICTHIILKQFQSQN